MKYFKAYFDSAKWTMELFGLVFLLIETFRGNPFALYAGFVATLSGLAGIIRVKLEEK